MATPENTHHHRCKECRERMDIGCSDATCDEGMRWVILCVRCYEKFVDHVDDHAIEALRARVLSAVEW